MLSDAGLAVVLFVSTNIDDIFVLVGFLGDPRFRLRQVIAGQYVGMAALVVVSAVASLVSLVLAPAYVGLLGLLPIAIGLKGLFELWRKDDDPEETTNKAGLGNVLTVAAVTIASGGDNIGVYTPVFATSAAATILTIVVVFAILTAAWIAFSHWLVNHPALGAPIRRFSRPAMPIVLIAIGVFVLYEAGSFDLLRATPRGG